MNCSRNMQLRRRLGWPPDPPFRHYVWGVLIAACGGLAILGMAYLLGQ
ncbi:MAG: hypothetical protein Q8N00_01565 [Nitrospirota bacterium]|nr:hypothetical protein [Nitrospirota bacterium]MDP3598518.1 hypothetical protein [Nitrospirota bacterium]